jgi:hypothetical protein
MKRWIASLVVVGLVGQGVPVCAQTVEHPSFMAVTHLTLVRTTPDLHQDHSDALPAGTIVTVIGKVGKLYLISGFWPLHHPR